MICPLTEIKAFLDIPETDDSLDDIINPLHAGVETCLKNVCQNEFESTTYANERYSGSGSKLLKLDNSPVTAVTRVSIGSQNAIEIKNSSTDMNMAYASISSTTLTLVVEGGANVSTTALAFATYTTLTLLVAQINATGKGWTAALCDSNDANIKSTDLIQGTVHMQGGRGNTTASTVNLKVAEAPITGFDWDEEAGIIYYSGGFPSGTRNVGVWYVAGYSSTTMPDDLKMAIMIWVKSLYNKRDEEGFGISRFSTGGYSVSYTEVPDEVNTILGRGGYLPLQFG